MTEIIGSLEEIDPGYSALFCDLWGCLHDGVRAFPEAVAALEGFRAPGRHVVLLTNSPRPPADVARQLDTARGAALLLGPVVSSGDAAQAAMAAGQFGRRVFHIGPERDLGFFRYAEGRPIDIERVPLEEAEGIVCTGLFDDRTRDAGRLPGDHPLRQDQGAEAALRQPRHRRRRRRPAHLLRRGDRRSPTPRRAGRSYYFGKPHPPIYALARRELREQPATSCRSTRSSASATASPRTSRARWARTSTRSSSPAASRPRRPGTSATAGPDPALLAAYLAEARMSPRLAMAYLR